MAWNGMGLDVSLSTIYDMKYNVPNCGILNIFHI